MDKTDLTALTAVLGDRMIFMTEIIAAVILACRERNAIDLDKLGELLHHAASRPDVPRSDRAMVERLIALLE